MKQAKTTARLIRTCDTCAHPYLHSTAVRIYMMIQLHYYSSVAACIVGTQVEFQYTTPERVHVVAVLQLLALSAAACLTLYTPV